MKNDFFKEYIDLTEEGLKRYLIIEETPQKKVFDAMGYSLFAGGKRLRPMIMMMTAKMLGKEPNIVLPFACAMEMIHTYSLIHDDLPAMDNDDLRRGKPTNHKVFGEATAILAGDGLLTRAFEIVSSYKENCVSSEQVLRAINVLATSAGANGMIGGQIVDIESHDEDLDLLRYLHSLKTGAIIRSSGVIGAILSGATEKQIKAIDDYCYNLGIAFQIQDDILDVLGDEATLGKPIGSDAENNKSTYISLLGLEKSQELSIKHTNISIEALSIFENADELIFLAKTLTDRKA